MAAGARSDGPRSLEGPAVAAGGAVASAKPTTATEHGSSSYPPGQVGSQIYDQAQQWEGFACSRSQQEEFCGIEMDGDTRDNGTQDRLR